MAAVPTKRIFIVDDHPLIRRGLRQLFEPERHLIISGEADGVDDAITKMQCAPPDIAIVDISLSDGNGFELLKRLHILQPQLPTLVCSMHVERFFIERALLAGARGYVSKLDAPEHLVDAVKVVLAGKHFIGGEMDAKELQKYLHIDPANSTQSPVEALTNRELEVFEQIGAGENTAQIADHLNVSVKTVESHRSNIKEKLNLHTAAELTRSALYWVMRDLQ